MMDWALRNQRRDYCQVGSGLICDMQWETDRRRHRRLVGGALIREMLRGQENFACLCSPFSNSLFLMLLLMMMIMNAEGGVSLLDFVTIGEGICLEGGVVRG